MSSHRFVTLKITSFYIICYNMLMSGRLLLGVTGHAGAGKTVAGDYLVKQHGFAELPGSAYLKDEAAKQGIELKAREDYGVFQRKLRTERSASFITDLMLELPGERIVNVGIRNRYDTEKLLSVNGLIIALICPAEVRFNRKNGTGPKYPDDFETFLETELLEYDNPDPLGQHTQWTMDRA